MALARKIEPAAKADADRRLFNAVGAFLAEHRLQPSPANYLLAHELVTRSNAAALAAVEAATSDGVRLTQGDADRIMKSSGIGNPGESDAVSKMGGEALDQAQRQLEIVESIVGDTQAHAERYGRELETSAAQLSALPDQNPIEDLLRITAGMMERTKAAEKQLQRTTEEVQSLRRELASASQEARTDPLTGLPNRRALEDRLALLQENGEEFSAAVCDIDRFKAVNDGHGHAVGDRVLKAIAQVLEESCPGHMVARFGGEEFVVLLAGTDVAAAAELLDLARFELGSRSFKVRETDDSLGSITISAGVAQLRRGETWTELLMRADTLLYEAKAAGRNRIKSETGFHQRAPS
jgi:diguanylate cyclase